MRRLAPCLFALLALTAPAGAEEPMIQLTELHNGLDLIVVEKHDVPLVTIEIAVRTGSFTENPDTNGLSHLYEHMFFKGNAALPTQERYMARVSELGISFNGTTSTERVNYFITLPSRNFPEGMKFMADAILTPLFNEAELVSEREVVIGEYDRNEANPSHYLWEGLRHALYGDQAFRKNPLGERHVILSATQETMQDFKATYYVPNNAALFIVGDVNLTEARVLAERLLGPSRWARAADPHAVPRPPLPRLTETKTFVVHQPTENVTLGAHWPGPDVGRDERATFVADVWGTLLGLPHGRFQRTFRDRGLADGASLHYYTQREGGEIQFSAVVRDGQKEGKALAVRDALLAEIEAMAEPGYWSDEELALAKQALAIDRAYSAETGAEFSHTLSFWWASSSMDYYTRYLHETGAVTADELRAFVRNYLLGRPFVMGCLLSEENARKLELTAEKLAPPPPSTAAAAASAVEELQLDNGLKVLFRRAPGTAVTALDVYIDGETQRLDASKQGIDQLLMACVLEGTRSTPREVVQERLVSLGARPGVDVNYDFLRISMAAPRPAFAEAVKLLGESLREPLLAQEVVEQRKSQMLTGLRAERSNPDSYVVRLLNEAFFAGHPYQHRPDGTLETVPTFTPEALRARLGQLLQASGMLAVLVGDMDSASARRLLNEQFGSLPRGSFERAALPAFEPGQLVRFEQRGIPTTYVIGKCAAPAPGEADYPAMRVATRILHRRFWESLRTKHALTYAPAAGLSVFRGNYAYVYASSTQPQRAIELMYAEIRRLQQEPVEEAVLNGVISEEETRAYRASETSAGHAQGLGRAALSAGDWRYHYAEPDAISRVTVADVQRVAQRYLGDFTWGAIGPEAPPEQVLKGGEPAARGGE